MDDAETLSLLIGDIYDASLDAALWPRAFDRIRGFLGECRALLVSQDAVTKDADVHFMLGHEQRYVDLYKERYFKINPLFPTVMFLDVEQTQTLPDVMPWREFCQARFAKEWLAPQGICDGVFSTVEKSAGGCTLFMTTRQMRDGRVDDEMRRRFSLIVPHVRRSLLIGKTIEAHKSKAAVLSDGLDALASATFIVDATGRIVHANASGYTMLDQANVLRAPGGCLRTLDSAADQALLDIFTTASGGDAMLGRKGIAVPLQGRDEERYVAHVLPLTSGARHRAGVSYGAVAAVFVRTAAIDLPSPPVVIAEAFQLTPAELRVLFSVVEIGGTAEVADVLGISEATVKTHLHRIFAKTGTERRADLVKLVAGYCVAP